eukprot:1137433-Pelagomonas_calceolata.AAC.2
MQQQWLVKCTIEIEEENIPNFKLREVSQTNEVYCMGDGWSVASKRMRCGGWLLLHCRGRRELHDKNNVQVQGGCNNTSRKVPEEDFALEHLCLVHL